MEVIDAQLVKPSLERGWHLKNLKNLLTLSEYQGIGFFCPKLVHSLRTNGTNSAKKSRKKDIVKPEASA